MALDSSLYYSKDMIMVLLEVIGAVVVVLVLGVGLVRVLRTTRFVDPNSSDLKDKDKS